MYYCIYSSTFYLSYRHFSLVVPYLACHTHLYQNHNSVANLYYFRNNIVNCKPILKLLYYVITIVLHFNTL